MLAFATGASLRITPRPTRSSTSPRMADSASVVDKYFPSYQKHRAPLIKFDGENGVSVAMPRVEAFAEVDKTSEPLFDYNADDAFIPDKPTPPSPIAWPAGDGRGDVFNGSKGSFNQPNLKEYGPFPDFFKRSCDG